MRCLDIEREHRLLITWRNVIFVAQSCGVCFLTPMWLTLRDSVGACRIYSVLRAEAWIITPPSLKCSCPAHLSGTRTARTSSDCMYWWYVLRTPYASYILYSVAVAPIRRTNRTGRFAAMAVSRHPQPHGSRTQDISNTAVKEASVPNTTTYISYLRSTKSSQFRWFDCFCSFL